MSRVALVTGGSRGIGAAISKALKDAGYAVAATYAGNDEAAAAFTAKRASKPTNGTSPTTKKAPQASHKSKPILALSTLLLPTRALRATRRSTG